MTDFTAAITVLYLELTLAGLRRIQARAALTYLHGNDERRREIRRGKDGRVAVAGHWTLG
jgi:hypothetical protein